MTVNDLMHKLLKLFPASFAKPEALASWTEIAHEALDRFAGLRLEVAYNHVMAGWTKGFAPKPGDFLAALGGGGEGASNGSANGDDDWPTRRRKWAQHVLENPGKYNSDAERVARQMARDHGY